MNKNDIRILENQEQDHGEAAYFVVKAIEISDYCADTELSDYLSDDPNEDAKRLFWNSNHGSEYVYLGSSSIGVEWGDEHIKWHLMDDDVDETEEIKDAYIRCLQSRDSDRFEQEIFDSATGLTFVFSSCEEDGWLASVDTLDK